jgi:hypothetical protein
MKDTGSQAAEKVIEGVGSGLQAAEKVGTGMEICPSAAKAGPFFNHLRTG